MIGYILCHIRRHKWSLWGFDPDGPLLVRHCERCYHLEMAKVRTGEDYKWEF